MMEHASHTSRIPPDAAHQPDVDSDSIDFGTLARTLWSYRRVILLGTGAVLALYGLFLLSSLILRPVRQEGILAFRLPFSELEYPNRAKFSPDDIIAIPVLQEVFLTNQLERYGDFTTFRSGFLVAKSSAQLDMLASEYRARLAEPRLAAGDRARIELEFDNKRQLLLAEPAYALTFTRASRRTEMPRLLINKVLVDVLATWARQADERKGVLRANVVFFSRTALRKDFFGAEEPIIGADILRIRARRILESLATLGEVQGSAAARVGDAEDWLSLADAQGRVQDTLSVGIRPAITQMQAIGVMRSPQAVRSYFESRLQDAQAQRDEAARRVVAIRQSLSEYAAERSETRPQSGPGEESRTTGPRPQPGAALPAAPAGGAGAFFDSIVQLSTRRQDATYRQTMVTRLLRESDRLAEKELELQHYQSLAGAIGAPGARSVRELPPSLQLQLEQVIGQLEQAVDGVATVYRQLLERNLTSQTMLYSLTEPFVLTTRNGLSGVRTGLGTARVARRVRDAASSGVPDPRRLRGQGRGGAVSRAKRDLGKRLFRPSVILPLLVLAAIVAAYAWLPVERTGTIPLQLLFDGADRGRYPNGTPFSAQEIIEPPVLREVLRRLEMSGRGSFEAFSGGFFVTQSSLDLERVHDTYRALLDDANLSPVDRSRLESEYRSRLTSAAGEPELLLGFRQPPDFSELSPTEVERILNETLITWAEAAEKLKGALRFDINVVGPRLVERQATDNREFLVAVDSLRVPLVRMLTTIEDMERVPGFAGATLEKERLTIDDVRAEVNDLLELRVQPLLRQGVVGGYAHDAEAVLSYFRSRRQQVGESRQLAALRASSAQEALRDYATRPNAVAAGAPAAQGDGTTLIPQVNEAFLERLLQLSDGANDVQFRQRLTDQVVRSRLRLARFEREDAYYAQALTLVAGLRSGALRDVDAGYVRARAELSAALDAATRSAGLVNRLYEDVSRRSLGNAGEMYRRIRSFSFETRRAVGARRGGIAALTVLLGALALGRLLERWFSGAGWRRAPRRPAVPPAHA